MSEFTHSKAVREQVPLLIGLMGPSGGGKTYSALRLATGMAAGPIFLIDTEARRGLHYADMFDFQHVQFDAPFGSLRYLDAIRHCVDAGAKCIIIDSMSHEHDGQGGMLETHEAEVERMAGNDYAKQQRVKMLAWAKPKAERRKLIQGILQINCNFIFCFRAKEKTKPAKDDRGKSIVQPMGFMAIAGDEFVYEMTVNMLLLPGAGGVPTWNSGEIGERAMIKLPQQFIDGVFNGGPLDESTGAKLAAWAKGGVAKAPTATAIPKAQALSKCLEPMDWPAWFTTAGITADQFKAYMASVGMPSLRELDADALAEIYRTPTKYGDLVRGAL